MTEGRLITVAVLGEIEPPELKPRDYPAIDYFFRGYLSLKCPSIFEGVTHDRRALFTTDDHPLLQKITVLTLDEVKNFLKRLPHLTDLVDKDLLREIEKQFRDAKWALAMDRATPNEPLLNVIRSVRPNFGLVP